MTTSEAEIVGIVEGTAGEVVGGWAQLAKRPRRFAGGELRVRTADGRVVELAIGQATLDPIERVSGAWGELERHPAARLCAEDAPAPDAEVDLKFAVVRGGDRIAAWGEVTETALVEASGDAFRAGAERVVDKLAASAVAIGADCEARLVAVKAEQARREAQSQRDHARAVAAAKPDRPAAPGPAITDRLRVNWGLVCVGSGAGIGAAWCAITPSYWIVPAVLAMCVLLAWPLVLDALLLPPFRTLPSNPRRSLEVPGVGFIIIGALAMMCAYGYGDVRDETPGRARVLLFVGFGLAGGSFVAALICVLGTQARRRMLRRLAVAPPHPRPLVDGVWGATDGRLVGGAGGPSVGLTPVAIASGEKTHWWGSPKRDSSTGITSRSSSTTKFEGFAPTVELEAADASRVAVQLAGARWFSTTQLSATTGSDRAEQADVVAFGTPVRVVGRARDGALSVGGDESLLVFASADAITRALPRARRRDQLALALAAVGTIGWVVTLVREIVG